MPSEDWFMRKMRETYPIRSSPGKLLANVKQRRTAILQQSELSQSSVGAQSELQSELSRSLRFTTLSSNRMKKKSNLERIIPFVRLHDAEIP